MDKNIKASGPHGATGKEPTCQCWRCKRHGFNTWVGKIPWRRKWQPTSVLLSGEFHGQKSLAGYSPRVRKELDMKSRDITLPTKVRLVKAMVFPVIMYGCESWTVKKAEH